MDNNEERNYVVIAALPNQVWLATPDADFDTRFRATNKVRAAIHDIRQLYGLDLPTPKELPPGSAPDNPLQVTTVPGQVAEVQKIEPNENSSRVYTGFRAKEGTGFLMQFMTRLRGQGTNPIIDIAEMIRV